MGAARPARGTYVACECWKNVVADLKVATTGAGMSGARLGNELIEQAIRSNISVKFARVTECFGD
jgi:hypothetical protein